ncbi:MAG: class I SAM-dependent methyltransferase [Bacteroidetes bacterium]|nr:class I SAM-dependent methyltransferase [Bacteroidota bacterium]
MADSKELKLGSVQETLLLPLWGRAVETRKERPLLIDKKAVSIIKTIPYDFAVISKNISRLTRAAWIARSIYLDKKILSFINSYPDATVVNVGCGLDTTFDRVDNGKIQWIDLDLPDSIELRRKYISESFRRSFISCSVFDKSWYSQIRDSKKVMIMLAGVIYYFAETEVKNLFNDIRTYLPGAEMIFDYSSKKGVEVANKRVIDKGGMDKSAYLKWGIDNIYEIEKWFSGINVLETIPIFREHKKNYPLYKRIGFNISDALKIMSLARVKVNAG